MFAKGITLKEKPKVWIFDDNAMDRELTEAHFKSAGFEVGSDENFKRVHIIKADVKILDNDIPRQRPGIEYLKEIPGSFLYSGNRELVRQYRYELSGRIFCKDKKRDTSNLIKSVKQFLSQPA